MGAPAARRRCSRAGARGHGPHRHTVLARQQGAAGGETGVLRRGAPFTPSRAALRVWSQRVLYPFPTKVGLLSG